MSVDEPGWQISHLESSRIDVESPARLDDLRARLGERARGEVVLDLRKGLFGLLQ